MPEVFLGDLSQVKVFDILKPLLMGKKTGKLSFKGKENGEIYIELGSIVHVKTPGSSGEYSFFSIMGWKMGRIIFEPDEPPPERTISIPTEQLLLNWSSKKMEWDKLQEVIPSNSHVFRLSVQKGGENKNISPDQWNVLAMSDGIKTTSDIAKILGWDELKTMRMTYQLVQAGLLESAEVQKPLRKKMAGEKFFLTIDNELKKVIGPVAPLIIEDKLSELRETKDSFPEDQALSLIESLGEEISNDLKKKEFLKVMTDFLSTEKKGAESRRIPGVDVKL
jgi:hypothetical protein